MKYTFNLVVNDFIEYSLKRNLNAKTVYYKSQEGGGGDEAWLSIEEFSKKYGKRKMNDFFRNGEFYHEDGTRDLEQYIKSIE